MKKHLQKTFETYGIQPSDTLILGVSGGVDSMVLLDIVASIHPRNAIIVCHINHLLRSDSNMDEKLVKETCKQLGIHCSSAQINVKEAAKKAKISTEMAGRELRYAYFEKVRQSEKAKYIITAHHKNDSIETILLNFAKGSRLRGLTGIQERQGSILRPFLEFTKEAIQQYATVHNIAFREDSTNIELQYQRNRIRNIVVPELTKINPQAIEAIYRTAEYFREVDRMMEGYVGVFLCAGKITEDEFGAMSPLIRKTLIEKLYAEANKGTIGLSQGNIMEIERYILTAHGGTVKKLGNLVLTKQQRCVRWDFQQTV